MIKIKMSKTTKMVNMLMIKDKMMLMSKMIKMTEKAWDKSTEMMVKQIMMLEISSLISMDKMNMVMKK